MKVNEKIEEWYAINKRDLPFRKTSNPYDVWVSEIMAQQTRIDTMLPYYIRWMNKWPTISDLANADIQDVLHAWQGLGYYNRARKLHASAKIIIDKFEGVFPDKKEDILSIDGIGEYTAGAILSICFNQNQPAVDGNVFRVVTRYKAWSDDITKLSTRRKVTELCTQWMKGAKASYFTQGLMELGAIICTPKNPKCSLCPLEDGCKAYKLNQVDQYPVKTKAKAPQEIEVYTYVLIHNNKICISQDDSDGLMIGYYRLPQFEDNLPLDGIQLKKRKHVFSHRIWHMNCYYKEVDSEINLEYCKWIKIENLKDYPLVTAHKKLLMSIIGKHIF